MPASRLHPHACPIGAVLRSGAYALLIGLLLAACSTSTNPSDAPTPSTMPPRDSFGEGERENPPKTEGLTVAAATFEVSLDQSQYFLVSPFERLEHIWVEVRNTGNLADTIRFRHPDPLPEGWGIHAGGYIHLEPGETGSIEIAIAGYAGGDKNIALEFRIESSREVESKTSITIHITYDDLDNAQTDGRIVRVYDRDTKSPITEAAVNYRVGSRYEGARRNDDGAFDVQIPSYQAVAAFADQYGIPWSGYALEVYAPGYQSYSEDSLTLDGPEREVYLSPLEDSVSFEPSWIEELEHPGVWRVVALENGDYFAAAMGKHPDEGDVMGPTEVHFFGATEGLLWSYPVESWVWGIDINPGGSLVAAGTFDGALRVLDRSGDLVWSHDFGDSALREVRFSNTGAYIGVEGNPIKIFDTSNGTVVSEIVTPVDPVWRGITFLGQDDKQVLYGGDNDLLLLDIEKKEVVWHRYISALPYDVMVTEELSHIVVADKGDTLWSFNAQGDLLWHHSHLDVLTDADMAEDGSRIVALSHDGTVRMFDGEGDLLWTRHFGQGGHNGIDMTADGGYIAVGGGSMESPFAVFLLDGDGNLLWQHSQSGLVLTPDHPYTFSTMSVAISDDGSSIVAGYGTQGSGVELFESR